MLRIFFSTLITLLFASANAQDVIVKTDNSTLKSKVLEISDTEIKYKKWENLEGPTYSTNKSLVIKIVYQNGSIDVFKEEKGEKKPEVKQKPATAKPPVKPSFKKYTSQHYKNAFNQFIDNRTEYFEADSSLAGYAMIEIPELVLYNTAGEKVKVNDYINTNKKFQDKPTLLMTWSATWCGPCIKIIDSLLLTHKITDQYNLVLVSRDDDSEKSKESKSYISLENTIAFLKNSKRYNYWKNALLLFDRDNRFKNMDDETTPTFLWLDKDLKIFNMYIGYDINIGFIPYLLGTTVKYSGGTPMVFRYGKYPGDTENFTVSLERRKIDEYIQVIKTIVYKRWLIESKLIYFYSTNNEGKIIPVSNSVSNSDLTIDQLEKAAKDFLEKKEYQRSLEYYEAAAKKGSVIAMLESGVINSAYIGDFGKSYFWYEKATLTGNEEAMIKIGDIYLTGRGTTKDHSKAVEWYKRAADKGNRYAMNLVALRYRYGGPGLEKNLDKSKEWYAKACAAGHKSSCNVSFEE